MGAGELAKWVFAVCVLAALVLMGCRVLQRAGVDRFAVHLGDFLICPFAWAMRLLQAALDGLAPTVMVATRGLRDYCRDIDAEWVIMWELVVYGLAMVAGWLVVRADFDYTYMRLAPLFTSTGGSFDGDGLSRQLALAFVLTGVSLGMLTADLVGLTPAGRSILFYGLADRRRKAVLVALLLSLAAFIVNAALLALYGIEASLNISDPTSLGVSLVLFAILLQVAVIGTLICLASAGGAAAVSAGWLLVGTLWLLAWISFLPLLLIAGALLVVVSAIFLLAQVAVEMLRFLRRQPPEEAAAVSAPAELKLPAAPTLHIAQLTSSNVPTASAAGQLAARMDQYSVLDGSQAAGVGDKFSNGAGTVSNPVREGIVPWTALVGPAVHVESPATPNHPDLPTPSGTSPAPDGRAA